MLSFLAFSYFRLEHNGTENPVRRRVCCHKAVTTFRALRSVPIRQAFLVAICLHPPLHRFEYDFLLERRDGPNITECIAVFDVDLRDKPVRRPALH